MNKIEKLYFFLRGFVPIKKSHGFVLSYCPSNDFYCIWFKSGKLKYDVFNVYTTKLGAKFSWKILMGGSD